MKRSRVGLIVVSVVGVVLISALIFLAGRSSVKPEMTETAESSEESFVYYEDYTEKAEGLDQLIENADADMETWKESYDKIGELQADIITFKNDNTKCIAKMHFVNGDIWNIFLYIDDGIPGILIYNNLGVSLDFYGGYIDGITTNACIHVISDDDKEGIYIQHNGDDENGFQTTL